ncbi:DUF4012 domain-containing protein [Plantibacter auratus]|uniref:DUF4012 domain-containing protein n=1 Tax=Plantibacter auratus TaxID=272914 RepID=UPI003D342137
MTVSRSSTRPRRLSRPRVLIPSAVALSVLLGIAGASVSAAVEAMSVREELESVLPELETIRAGGDGGGTDAIDPAAVERAGDALERALASTQRPDWWLAERVPVSGANFEAVRTAVEAAHVVVDEVVEPVLALSLDGLAVDGRLDTERVGRLARSSARALERLEEQVARLDRLDRSVLLPQVVSALGGLDGPLREASSLAARLAPVLRALPGFLGEEGPRDVVVLFQNSAESRALGGIAGASVLVHVEEGVLSVTRTLGGADFVSHADPVVPLPADADALYRTEGYAAAGTSIHEVTARPDFPYGAQVASRLWEESQGVVPDLVLAVDPVALSHLLRATGPVELADGTEVSSKTVVDELLNGVYRDHPGLSDEANRAQDATFTAVVQALTSQLQAGSMEVPRAIDGWVQAVDDRRLLAWSPDRVEERALVLAGVGGALPERSSRSVPFGLYLSDAVGSKLEYYLRQQVRVRAGSCDVDGTRTVMVTSELSNTIDTEPELDTEAFDYIAGFHEREGLPRGWMRLRVMAYAPDGAVIRSVRVDGVEVPYAAGSDDGRPVAYVVVAIAPGATVTLDVDADVSGATVDAVRFEGTPGVRAVEVDNVVEPC